jgi:hypothetical protein
MYATGLKVFDNEFVELFLLFRSEWVHLTVTGLCTRNQFDGMIPRLSHRERIERDLGEYILKIMDMGRNTVMK